MFNAQNCTNNIHKNKNEIKKYINFKNNSFLALRY